MKMRNNRTTVLRTTLAATCLLALGAGGVSTAQAHNSPATTKSTTTVTSATALEKAVRAQKQKPTIVLVHGAFADASGWQAVATKLMADGYPVYAPPNPLRSLDYDAAYLRSFLATIEGPVVLVGHSYGGAVITNASTGNPNVKGLVYIAAYALQKGETVADANQLGGHPEESLLLANVRTRAYPKPFPDYPDGDADVYIKDAPFRKVFAADLPRKTTQFMAASQRPGSYFSLGTPSGEPGWKTIPSWYLVALDDKAIPPTAEKTMAKRAHAHTRMIHSSHVAMMSHPKVVTNMIEQAATS